METLTDKLTAWLAYGGERAVKTFAQAALAAIGTDAIGLLDVDWVTILSVAGLATVLSLLTSVLTFRRAEGAE